MWFSILLTTIILYFLRNHYNYIRGFFLSRKTDGPPAYPIIGSGLLFYNKSPAGIILVNGSFHKKCRQFRLCCELFIFFLIAKGENKNKNRIAIPIGVTIGKFRPVVSFNSGKVVFKTIYSLCIQH